MMGLACYMSTMLIIARALTNKWQEVYVMQGGNLSLVRPCPPTLLLVLSRLRLYVQGEDALYLQDQLLVMITLLRLVEMALAITEKLMPLVLQIVPLRIFRFQLS